MFLAKGKSIISEPISDQCSHFIAPEKTRKLKISKGFLVFPWVVKIGTFARHWLIDPF